MIETIQWEMIETILNWIAFGVCIIGIILYWKGVINFPVSDEAMDNIAETENPKLPQCCCKNAEFWRNK